MQIDMKWLNSKRRNYRRHLERLDNQKIKEGEVILLDKMPQLTKERSCIELKGESISSIDKIISASVHMEDVHYPYLRPNNGHGFLVGVWLMRHNVVLLSTTLSQKNRLQAMKALWMKDVDIIFTDSNNCKTDEYKYKGHDLCERIFGVRRNKIIKHSIEFS